MWAFGAVVGALGVLRIRREDRLRRERRWRRHGIVEGHVLSRQARLRTEVHLWRRTVRARRWHGHYGMLPERILQGRDLVKQAHRVKRVAEAFQLLAALGWTQPARQQTLQRRLGSIIPARHLTALAALAHQFHGRLKEVDVEPHRPIQFGQLAIGALALEAIVADELADDRAIFLLDKALIVLAISSTARKRDLLALTKGQDLGIEKLAPVVGVESQERKWEQLLGTTERLNDDMLTALGQGEAFGPASGDVGEDKRIEKAAFRTGAAMSDEISLDKARSGIVPIGEGTNRNLMFEQAASFGGGAAMRALRLAMFPEDAVSGSRTDGEQLGANLGGEDEMTMALKAGDQVGEKGYKTLGADEVGSRPGGDKRILDGRSIGTVSRPREWCRWRDRLGQETNGILAGIAGGCDEFIEDDRLLGVGGVLIAGSDLCK